jgi:uncharacterized damage-inducible protein DinB
MRYTTTSIHEEDATPVNAKFKETDDTTPNLLEALLGSWDRNNTILLNLLRAIPTDGLKARAAPDSPSVAQMFTHIHFVRLVFVLEDAPEFAIQLPKDEWADERDVTRIASMLEESAETVSDAMKGRLETGKAMNLHYDHPILFLQHMIWHEGYHHGQIKLVLKLAGLHIPDDAVGAGTWGIWMNKSKAQV